MAGTKRRPPWMITTQYGEVDMNDLTLDETAVLICMSALVEADQPVTKPAVAKAVGIPIDRVITALGALVDRGFLNRQEVQ